MTSKIEVPREFLNKALEFMDEAGWETIAEELRAMLAAPEAPRQDDRQMASMPVERCYDVRAKMIIAFNESRKNGGDLDDGLDAAYKAALRYSPAMQSTVVGEAERLNGMLDAASELLRTKQRANRELRSELERIKTINDNNFNLLLDQIFAAPLSPDHSGGGAGMVLPVAWIKPDVAKTLRKDECCYAFGENNPKGTLIPLYASPPAPVAAVPTLWEICVRDEPGNPESACEYVYVSSTTERDSLLRRGGASVFAEYACLDKVKELNQ